MRRRQKCRQKQLGGERTLLATANATSRMGQGLIAQKANLQKKCRTANDRSNGSLSLFVRTKRKQRRLRAAKRANAFCACPFFKACFTGHTPPIALGRLPQLGVAFQPVVGGVGSVARAVYVSAQRRIVGGEGVVDSPRILRFLSVGLHDLSRVGQFLHRLGNALAVGFFPPSAPPCRSREARR